MSPERYKKVGEVFRAAADLPREERGDYLSDACDGDDELRHEVESLLASDENVGDFIDAPAIQVAAEILADEQAKTNIGREIAHYKIVSLIGVGGMGEVWLARDTRLKRQVALKLLASDQLTAKTDSLRRFEQEAFAVSALNHPNIITIFDIGVSDGWQFIATEFVDGKTLRQMLRERPLSIREAIDIAVQICAALSAAHSAGIIHRDIKPENVMVREDGIVKVLDFGLARFTERSLSKTDAKFTTTTPGMVMGTVSYMSPEQARGQKVDERTDIFSLGILLYEMLASRSPFEGVNAIEILAAILDRDPAPLDSQVPDAAQAIVSRAMIKSLDGRYQTAADMLSDLRSVQRRMEFRTELERHTTTDGLSNEPTIEMNAVTGENVPRRTGALIAAVSGWSLRNKIAAAAVMLLIASVGTFLAVRFLPRQNASAAALTDADKLLIGDFENKTGDEDFDGILRQPLAVALAQSPFISLVSDGQVRQTLKLMEKPSDEPLKRDTAREICQRRGVKVFLIGSIENLGVQYLITLEAFNTQTGESAASQQIESENKEAVLASLNEATVKMREKLGESLASIEKFDAPIQTSTTNSLEALKMYTAAVKLSQSGKSIEAIPAFKRAIELDPEFAAAYGALAIAYYNEEQFTPATEYAEKAYALRDRTTERERLRFADFYYAVVTGELDKDVGILEIFKQTYPRDNLAPANLAVTYLNLGKFEKSEENSRIALGIDPTPFAPHTNLGKALLRQSRFDESKIAYQEGLNRGLQNVDFLTGLFHIAFVKNEQEEMGRLIEEIKKLQEGSAYLMLGNPAIFAGKWREYEKHMNQAVAASEKNSPDSAADYSVQAALHAAALGKCIDALRWANRAQKYERSQPVLMEGALVFALCDSDVEPLVEELKRRFPKSTLVNAIWLPIIRSATQLKTDPDRAIESLEVNRQYEGAAYFWDNYLRGQAYLKLNKAEQAAAEFEKILQNRGWSPHSPLYTLAQLERAHAYNLLGRADIVQESSERFFNQWGNADKDLPVFKKVAAFSGK